MPILAVPGGAQLVTFNRPIWAISRSQRDLALDDLGKDQHLHRAGQFREPDERMMVFWTFLGVQQSLQMLATDSVAIWMSRGCEPSSVLVFPAVLRDTGVFFFA